MNNGISVNPSRTIMHISLKITIMKSGTQMRRIGFGWNRGDGIPQRNIGIFSLFDIETLDLSGRITLWNGTAKSESEKPEGNIIFKNAGCENNFEVIKVGYNFFVILNHVDSNHTNTN